MSWTCGVCGRAEPFDPPYTLADTDDAQCEDCHDVRVEADALLADDTIDLGAVS